MRALKVIIVTCLILTLYIIYLANTKSQGPYIDYPEEMEKGDIMQVYSMDEDTILIGYYRAPKN